MLRACKYCGKIHDSKYRCAKAPVREKKILSRADYFRRGNRWTNKSIEVRERDHFLCQACIRGLPGAYRKYNYNDISVHHIVPINEDWDRRLDNDNLITLCNMHHEMAESGEIEAEVLVRIAKEQEGYPPGC